MSACPSAALSLCLRASFKNKKYQQQKREYNSFKCLPFVLGVNLCEKKKDVQKELQGFFVFCLAGGGGGANFRLT